MNTSLYLAAILVAGGLGYYLEPQLSGSSPERQSETETLTEPKSESPPNFPQMDLSHLAPSQLPTKILINVPVKITNTDSGVVMSVEAGNHLKPVRIDGNNVVISPGSGPFTGEVAISDTDLVQQLTDHPPGPVTADAPSTAVLQQESAASADAPTPQPATEATPGVTPIPAEQPQATNTVSDSDIVNAMQENIREGKIKEFNFDQVLDWKAGTTEMVEGESYQTGLASYKADTIFGIKTIEAKALLKGGKVQRWIWPKSGLEIK
jgi:hypothetical protein